MTAAAATLETERLVLRGWRASDFAPLAEFYAHDSGAKYVGGMCTDWESWRSLAMRIGHWQLRGFGPYVLEEKTTGAWLGWCGLFQPYEFPEIELMYALREVQRGKGFVTEAATAVRNHAFGTLRLATLVSYIDPENAPSQQVAQRLGAQRDGTASIRNFNVDVWRHAAKAAAA